MEQFHTRNFELNMNASIMRYLCNKYEFVKELFEYSISFKYPDLKYIFIK